MLELELKAVVPDADAVRRRLRAVGAHAGYAGRMTDLVFDRGGELSARGEVLRIRRYRDVKDDAQLAWKGPTRLSSDGYKARRELEFVLQSQGADPVELLRALGYETVHRIDRQVELYRLGAASLRLEWYPEMDILLEVEGTPDAIEAAIAVTGLPRAEFTAEPLAAFAARFTGRTGRSAVLALAPVVAAAPDTPG